MRHRGWLVKTDPRRFAFDDLRRSARTVWDGTRHPLALRHLRAMRRGDAVLVYHSGTQRAVVGVARVVRGAYRDRTGDWVVDLAARHGLGRPVRRVELAALPALATWELVRIPRLTILPVPGEAWRAVLQLAGRAPP